MFRYWYRDKPCSKEELGATMKETMREMIDGVTKELNKQKPEQMASGIKAAAADIMSIRAQGGQDPFTMFKDGKMSKEMLCAIVSQSLEPLVEAFIDESAELAALKATLKHRKIFY